MGLFLGLLRGLAGRLEMAFVVSVAGGENLRGCGVGLCCLRSGGEGGFLQSAQPEPELLHLRTGRSNLLLTLVCRALVRPPALPAQARLPGSGCPQHVQSCDRGLSSSASWPSARAWSAVAPFSRPWAATTCLAVLLRSASAALCGATSRPPSPKGDPAG
ncbi:hypothetical protein A4V12_06370 [Streptomyces noursei]|nr:hypothetical protein A4V12_06370 [Streptomyces noursei]